MADLRDLLEDRCLRELCIPGTHNSITSSLTKDVGPYPKPAILKKWKWLAPFALPWAICERGDVTAQLHSGVRYLDLRMAWDPVTEKLRFVHTFLGEEVAPVLQKIKDFVDEHPLELVFVSFEGFSDFTPDHHASLKAMIERTFGDRLARAPHWTSHTPLSRIWERGYSVVAFYGGCNQDFLHHHPFASYWPNADHPDVDVQIPNKSCKRKLDKFLGVSRLS